ncbi:serine/threonine-protein kinase [Haliangium sp.]|uniref:serine/threonine-protein kinase n=1 Tax=Haliangium sp. TaxID=2663208 RepID=UPI003D0F46EC
MEFPLGGAFPVAVKVIKPASHDPALHDPALYDPALYDVVEGLGVGGLPGIDGGPYVSAFVREAVVAMRFNHNHPNLVTTYDFGVSVEGERFLVMELVEGPSLRELRRTPQRCLPLSFEATRRVAIDILEGLAYLHGCGVLHRDISPGNILLSPTGGAKLADFGLVRHDEATHSGMFCGTAAYASPEALQGVRLSARSDLYSLAAVLYEVLTGVPPYGAESPVRVYTNMIRGAIEPLPADVPEDLADLVAGLLALQPSDRIFDAATAALAGLRAAGEPVASLADIGAVVAAHRESEGASEEGATAAVEGMADTLMVLTHAHANIGGVGTGEPLPPVSRRWLTRRLTAGISLLLACVGLLALLWGR